MIEILNDLSQGFRKRNPMALPEVVLHPARSCAEGPAAQENAADENADFGQILNPIGEELASHGVPFAKVRSDFAVGGEDGTGPEAPVWRARDHALRIVRELGGGAREGNPRVEHSTWVGDNRQYRRYPFPRSALLSTIEDAVQGLRGDNVQSAQMMGQLNSQGWRPNGTRPSARFREAAKDGSKTVPALLIALLATQVGDNVRYAVAFTVLVLVLVVVLSVLPGKAPLLLGLRREIRWFLGTTYLNQGPHADRREGRRWRTLRLWPPGSVRQRLNAVATDIAAGSLLDGAAAAGADEDAQRRHLHLRVHALREDLRDAHRVWSLDLRGRKRPTPPVLLLPKADDRNGGIELIKALSDIRSIRSELDPLLLVATVPLDRVDDLQHTVEWNSAASAPLDAKLPGWYTEWNRARRVNQSPSIATGQLPWVLRVPVSVAPPGPGSSRPSLSRAGRPGWTWLWSLPALVLVLLAVAAGAVVEDRHRAATYCDGGLLASNHDSVRKRAQNQQDTECVGVATGSVSFEGVAKVQKLIREANAEIGDDPHVTLVYAGPLSGVDDELVKGLEELRGAYAVQRANRNESVKLKILVANGGKDMYNQRTLVDRLVDLSRRDPSIVGVVGMGRDMTDSEEVQAELRKASLPVVSGTNSSTNLAEDYPNFFGLAATDKWQNDQLLGIAKPLADESQSGSKPRAVVLARTPASHDQYTREQKKYSEEMLTAAGFDVTMLDDYELPNGRATMDDQIADMCGDDQIPPRAVYFAGRSDDVTTLLNGLRFNCREDHPIAVLGGDDLSKAKLNTDAIPIPRNVTFYYPILTALECAAARSTDFYSRLNQLPAGVKKDLGLKDLGPEGKATWRSPDLANGQTALTHDATEVLYHAATADGRPRNRAETWANLRQQKVSGLATGTIDFTGIAPHRPRKGYGITLMQVGHGKDGSNIATVKLRQAAGSTDKLAQDCPKS
ncbi:ABC transporter substrate-binding protein [Streptomyces physcomitrii]|uniref:ABC transporter substrate-binding protein n=1 Tax=Streptomyces physcomitrii TaxID=2724184 RepID=A0ABX1H4Z1_9ACTN|nr:ABC transporter substrate-binding protein [Streptomyces physcomitrii]NKI43133.1 ABC transporter substrate-binding protein [Streptomyces physcomitrii]